MDEERRFVLSVKDDLGNWVHIPALKGNPGYSPEVTVERITGGHRVTITDATGPHSFDVMDGDGSTYDAGDVTYDPSEDYEGGSVGAALNDHNIGKIDKSSQAAKTSSMTQAVGIDTNGKLWTVPGGATSAVNSVNGKTGDVVLNSEDVGALPDDTKIPSKTSDLINDSGFLTEHQSLAAYRTASAQDTIDDSKVDKVTGKGLSTNDYTTAEKNKLFGIASGAEVNVQSDWNQTNTAADDFIKNKPTNISAFANDAGYLTQHQDISGKIDKSAQAAKTSEMTQAIGIDANGKLWVKPDTGGGGTSDYSELTNKPKINNVELSGNKTASALGFADVATSGSYDDLNDTPTIPSALSDLSADATHRTVSDTEKSTWNAKGTYSKPSAGIPKTDLASAVQTSLGKADSALQAHQDISGKIDKAVQAAKTDAMTSAVGIDSNGKLWAVPGGGSGGGTAGDITYDPSETYSNGTVGAALKGKLDINFGSSHANEFLVVGSDGNVTSQAFSVLEGGSY